MTWTKAGQTNKALLASASIHQRRTRGREKKGNGSNETEFQKVSKMTAEGVAAVAGSDTREAQVESELATQAGIMKSSCSEGVKFKRRTDPFSTPCN